MRAAQFHNLVAVVLGGLTRSPLVPVPHRFRLQPVETAAVADRLVELVSAEPAGMINSLAGPQILTAPELVGAYLDATRKRRATFSLPLPGRAGRCYAAGDNLTLDADTAGCTWQAFLSQQ